jgi:hypothetical protein
MRGLAISGVIGGLTGLRGPRGRVGRGSWRWRSRRQFSRFAYGSTPAFGRAVACFARRLFPGALPQAGICRAVGAGVLRGRRGVSRLWLAGWVVGKNAIQSFPGALSQAVICRAVGAGVLHGGRGALRDACAGRRGILRGCCADGEGSRAPEELAVARKSGGGWGRWVLEACLVNLHHAFVGFVLAFDEGLLVDV